MACLMSLAVVLTLDDEGRFKQQKLLHTHFLRDETFFLRKLRRTFRKRMEHGPLLQAAVIVFSIRDISDCTAPTMVNFI
jgi:hypothetical protein